MAERGRGRGRGLLASNIVLPSPGGGGDNQEAKKIEHSKLSAPSQTASSLSELEDKLNSLQLDVEEDDVKCINKLAVEASKSSNDVKRLAELIYNKCLENIDFAKSGALICNTLAHIDVDGTKFRTSVLSLLQASFKDKEEIRSASPSRFLGFFATLCQIFGIMRTASGEHFKPLVGPVFDTIDIILDAEGDSCNADEYECLLLQLQSIGKDLESHSGEQMMKLMDRIRTKIINNETSPRIRCTLLETVELYGRRFEQAPNDVTRFYCDIMAEILAGLVV